MTCAEAENAFALSVVGVKAVTAVTRLLRNPGSREVRVEVMDSLAPGSASVHITPVFWQTGEAASALFSPPPSPSQFYRITVRRSAGVP